MKYKITKMPIFRVAYFEGKGGGYLDWTDIVAETEDAAIDVVLNSRKLGGPTNSRTITVISVEKVTLAKVAE